jgi:subtilisin family serine protease
VVVLAGALVATAAVTTTAGAAMAHGGPKASYIVMLKGPAGGSHAAAAVAGATSSARARYGVSVTHTYTHIFRGYAATMAAAAAAALRADPGVAAVVPDGVVHAAACPVCQIPQIETRGFRRVGGDLSSAHAGDHHGAVNVNVAVLDSGIQVNQPELDVRGGVDCTGGHTIGDVEGHGTMVAGVIGARDNAIGIVGVVPGAHLWSVRVLDANLNGEDSWILCGLDWLAGTRADKNPGNDIAVANMSLTAPAPVPDDRHCGTVQVDPFHQAVCRAVDAGVTIVAAAGNDGTSTDNVIPATYSEVLTMTAMADSDGLPGGVGPPDPCLGTADDTAAFFSNYATRLSDAIHTLAAPGVCISSDYIGSNVATDSGTSFASPFGAGVVALCIVYGPCRGLAPRDIVRRVVADTARYNVRHRTWGYNGDPLHPIDGRYYGWMIRAALY